LLGGFLIFLAHSHMRDQFADFVGPTGMDRGWLAGDARLKLHTIKVEANDQEGDDNPSQSKGEHVAHVMSRHAPSRFSRGFDCRYVLLIGHNENPMGLKPTHRALAFPKTVTAFW
jgi:hypothetical protein